MDTIQIIDNQIVEIKPLEDIEVLARRNSIMRDIDAMNEALPILQVKLEILNQIINDMDLE